MYTIDKRFIWNETEQCFIRRIYDSEGNVVAWAKVYMDATRAIYINGKHARLAKSCSLSAAKQGMNERLRITLAQLNNETK